MKILFPIMWIVLVIFSFTATSQTNPNSETYTLINATNLAKLGCDSRCGDLIVPYPFGITGTNSKCSADPGFDIYCDTSIDPPKASFSQKDYLSIKLISDSTLRTSNVVATRCYPSTNVNVSRSIAILDFMNPVYTLSQVNKFMVIGCASIALLSSQTKSRNLSTACATFCLKPEDALVEECAGTGCCQSSIPKGINYIIGFFTLQDSPDLINIRSFNNCTYAFVGEESAFRFNGATDLLNTSFVDRVESNVPIVFEWAIGNLSCPEAEATDGFICQSNSTCVSSTRETGGYRCMCKEGYQGNPYLSPGCEDIDECKDVKKFPCYGNCVNTPGNYICKCKGGYSGDAKIKDGCRRIYKTKKLVTLFTSGIVLGIGILVFAIWMYKVVQKRKDTKRRENFFKRNGGLLLQQQISNGQDAVERTRLFSATELEKATDRYDRKRMLGRGGQGTVYKGMLTDGKIVAVKKSKSVDESQIQQFINEVFLLSQINHRNVIKLFGCCLETEVPILVYEFVSNGNLSQFIHDENYEFPTLWSIRLQIATEVAEAVAYLHCATSIPIYHRDIKSENILLDEKFRAKLSDFGISKSVVGDQTHLSTLVKGTFGYLDPEYFHSSQFTEKSDVYSFGVVLVELLTGKKPIHLIAPGEWRSLATLILTTEEGLVSKNIDDRVPLDGLKEQLIAVAKLAKRCLNLNGELRPTMKEVATELEGIRTSH